MSFCSFQTTEKGLELALLWINVAFFRKNCLVSSQYFALHRVLMAFLILNMSMKLFTAVDGWLLQVFEASSSQTTIARSDSICMEIFLAPYLISCIPVWFANKDISFLFPVGQIWFTHVLSLSDLLCCDTPSMAQFVCTDKVRGDSLFACACLNFIYTVKPEQWSAQIIILKWVPLQKAKCVWLHRCHLCDGSWGEFNQR